MSTEKKKAGQILLVTWSTGERIAYSGITNFIKRFPDLEIKRSLLYNYLTNKKLPYHHAECTIERIPLYRAQD